MLELHGITWDHPRGLLPMQATAAAFAQEHQEIHITWQVRSLAAFGEQPLEQLAQRYDLLVIDHPFIGTAVQSGSLLPLDDYLAPAFLSLQQAQSVGPGYQSYTAAGHQWALAIDAAAQVSAYRPDLLQAQQQNIPTTWDEVLAYAQKYRIAIPLAAAGAIDSFLTLCANLGEAPGQQAHTLVDRATARRALSLLRNLFAVAHPASLTLDPPHTLDTMALSDEIAYCPLLFGYSNYARSSERQHLCRFTNIPRAEPTSRSSGAILGGAGLAISAFCREPQAALAYAQWVASAECQQGLYVSAGGQPGNRLAWTDPAINAATHNFFLDTLDTLDQAYMRPRYAGFVPFHDQASILLQEHLRSGNDAEHILNQLDVLYRASRQGLSGLSS